MTCARINFQNKKIYFKYHPFSSRDWPRSSNGISQCIVMLHFWIGEYVIALEKAIVRTELVRWRRRPNFRDSGAPFQIQLVFFFFLMSDRPTCSTKLLVDSERWWVKKKRNTSSSYSTPNPWNATLRIGDYEPIERRLINVKYSRSIKGAGPLFFDRDESTRALGQH